MMKNSGEILSEKNNFNGRIFDVVTREIKTPDGLKVTRNVVLHGDAVAMIMPVLEQGETKYVIGKEFRAGMNEIRESIPAGLINDGESPKQAALREAQEEIGLKYNQAELIYKISTSEGFTNESTYLMLLSEFIGETNTNFDTDELVKKELFTLKELENKIKNMEITTAPAIIAVQYLNALKN